MEANSVRGITDFGGGDWQFSHLISWWQGEYLGLDAVPGIVDRNRRRSAVPNVRFETLTAIEDIPGGDLLISKEALEHLPNQTIIDYLTTIRKKYRFAILSNAVAPTSAKIDIVAGDWRPKRLQHAPLDTPGAVVFNYCSQAGNIGIRNAVFLMLSDASGSIARSLRSYFGWGDVGQYRAATPRAICPDHGRKSELFLPSLILQKIFLEVSGGSKSRCAGCSRGMGTVL